MGNRRMGRKRLFSLNKKGKDNANKAGPAFVNAIVSNTVNRSGHEIVTEIAIDLQGTDLESTGSAMTVDPGRGDVAGSTGLLIGQPGLTGSYLYQHTVAENGYLIGADMICTETPAGATKDIDLIVSTASTGSVAMIHDSNLAEYGERHIGPGAVSTMLIDGTGSWSAGDFRSYYVSASSTEHPSLPISGNITGDGTESRDGQYLYLARGNATTTDIGSFNAGKYVIRLYGIAAVADKKVKQPAMY